MLQVVGAGFGRDGLDALAYKPVSYCVDFFRGKQSGHRHPNRLICIHVQGCFRDQILQAKSVSQSTEGGIAEAAHKWVGHGYEGIRRGGGYGPPRRQS